MGDLMGTSTRQSAVSVRLHRDSEGSGERTDTLGFRAKEELTSASEPKRVGLSNAGVFANVRSLDKRLERALGARAADAHYNLYDVRSVVDWDGWVPIVRAHSLERSAVHAPLGARRSIHGVGAQFSLRVREVCLPNDACGAAGFLCP